MSFDPKAISRLKKERHLLQMSEEEFRDQIIRPLFLARGLRDGRDLCGPSEEGKDAIFLSTDPLGFENIYAVQTKAGRINLASKASRNLHTALTQLRTSLQTPISLLHRKTKQLPSQVILCASGEINDAAKKFIIEDLKSPQVQFMDVNDVISQVDEHLPQLWLGIDVKKYPYLARLRDSLDQTSEPGRDDISAVDPFLCPATADSFVTLQVFRLRIVKRIVKRKQVTETRIEELPVTTLRRRKERLILLVGDAGSGKSTALRRIAYQQAETSMETGSAGIVPILVRAVDISRSTKSILDLFVQHTMSVSRASSAAFTIDDLQEGHVQVLIDGLDEIPGQALRQELVDRIVGFSGQYPKCQVIISSRAYAWLDQLAFQRSIIRFTINPIDWKQTTKIVRRLQKGRNLSEGQTRELLRRLQDVHGMHLNPLLVTVFVSTSESSRVDIPANITELFKKFTEIMLGRWDEQKGFAQQYLFPLKDFLLCLVAVKLHKAKRTSMRLNEMKVILSDLLKERGQERNVDALVDEIVLRSGLFRILGEEVEFAHMLLQEFFAGRGLSEDEVLSLVKDEWWQRSIVFFFGENPSKYELLRRAMNELPSLNGHELAQSSVSLGLALQTCYLLTVDTKRELFVDVIDQISRASLEALTKEGTSSSHPLLDSIIVYLVGRDAVSCDVLWRESRQVKDDLARSGGASTAEHVEFWQLVGLIECGCIGEAYRRIKQFHPGDERLLLALHLGARVFAELRAGNSDERNLAVSISKLLDPKIAHLRRQILDELRTELLEIRQGKVAAIPGDQEVSEGDLGD